MADCIFCAIAAHRAPGAIFYEDEVTVALLDLHPLTRGHALVIPRIHCANVYELNDGTGEAVMRTVIRVAQALRAELEPDGLNLLQSNGRAAGQTVFHFHFHVVPRWDEDALFLPHGPLLEADRTDLGKLARALSQRL
jgi:histidine triad (HIT) family protein